MPIAILKSVREVSSEDPVHVAENLLKENAGKKWKTRSVGEKSAYVILEFADPQQVTGIDLGNEHSAFIEVLVSRSGCRVDDFKELLLSSSFMTPIESKNSSNQNRVRCFSGSALDSTVLTEKWKLLKIVCTQPFNKHVQYGLSFVKVHVTAQATATSATAAASKPKSLLPERIMQFGAYKLREESPDSDTDTPLMRFKRWKDSQQPAAPASTAAAIRDASAVMRRLSNTKPSSPSPAPAPAPVSRSASPAGEGKTDAKPLDRNRASLLFGDDDADDDADDKDARKQRLSKHLKADKDRRRVEQEKLERERRKEKSKRHSIDKAPPPKVDSPKPKDSPRDRSKESQRPRDSDRSKDSPRPSAHKRHSSPTRGAATPAKKLKIKEATIQYRPFNQLLRGVVLVISGIQNPDRADLRAKATAMGARYKADWESGCTHLICAFKNTPKYREVRGKGKIVTRSWIEKCHAHKKYLPWRRYALDTDEVGQPESDEELHDTSLKPKTRPKPQLSGDIEMSVHVPTDVVVEIDDADHSQENNTNVTHDISSGIDTEDELERVAHENILKKAKVEQQLKPKSRDVYDISTDEEDYLKEKKKQRALISITYLSVKIT
ncbi:DNA repair protein XRCC1 isoform X2 [Drosophila obscura]|uniref:DNA repair protein XRCC1 isoform X2 n=1 Tax=Drosophila obscura TaxID=7282 RepID=UPI001BB1AF67|nr:DNA repair protein XRCC1 isoform X2 [Drosophila obscura]